jgi:hypothetical protein
MIASADLAQVATMSIDEYEAAGEAYAQLLRRELELEADRPLVKAQAIARLMAQDNPQTSTAEKPKLHSASSAEAIVAADPAYAAHLAAQRTVVFDKNMALTRMTSAQLRADMAIGALRAQAAPLAPLTAGVL